MDSLGILRGLFSASMSNKNENAFQVSVMHLCRCRLHASATTAILLMDQLEAMPRVTFVGRCQWNRIIILNHSHDCLLSRQQLKRCTSTSVSPANSFASIVVLQISFQFIASKNERSDIFEPTSLRMAGRCFLRLY